MTTINTYNESNLHNTLKTIYALEYNGLKEQKFGSFICDIITDDQIIEIQTSNISSLKNKIDYAISQNKKIKIVHPIIESNTIETYTPQGQLLSKHKSPKHSSIYSSLRSLTKLTSVLLNKFFTLEILYVSAIELRIKTDTPVQTKNKSRRHLKNYIKIQKKLVSINKKQIFTTKEDYLTLLPQNLPNPFTPPQLKQSLLNQTWPPIYSKADIKRESSYYTLLIWILEKMKLISKIKKEGKSWLYKINHH